MDKSAKEAVVSLVGAVCALLIVIVVVLGLDHVKAVIQLPGPAEQKAVAHVDQDLGWFRVHKIEPLPETEMKVLVYCVYVRAQEGPCGGGMTNTALLIPPLTELPGEVHEAHVKVMAGVPMYSDMFRIVTELR